MTNTDTQPVDAETYTMLQEIMGDEFNELVGFFREDSEQALTQLQCSIDTQDSGQVGSICHKLKSSSRLIGAMAMAEIARTLEEYKDHHVQGTAHRHLQDLTLAYRQVTTWLDEQTVKKLDNTK